MIIRLQHFSASIFSLIILLSAGCNHEKNELIHEHDHEHEHGHKHDNNDHENTDEIILEPSQAKKMGVVISKIEPAPFEESIHVTGKVEVAADASGVIIAPASGVFTFSKNIEKGTQVTSGQTIGVIKGNMVSGGDRDAVALANLNSAKRELDRLSPLYEKKLVTAEKYNAAVEAYEVARAAYSPKAHSGLVTSPITGIITSVTVNQGQYVEAGTELAQISNGKSLTLVAEVPIRYSKDIPSIMSARIPASSSGCEIELKGNSIKKVNDYSLLVNSTPGYLPVSFSMSSDEGIRAGEIVEVYLVLATKKEVLSVPVEAVSEQMGQYFVYRQIDEEGYEKMPVTLGMNNGKEIEILSGLRGGERIVVHGVTALRLAESSGVVPEGHTHSH